MERKHSYEMVHQSQQLEKPIKRSGDVVERIIMEVGEMGTYQRWLFAALMPFGFSFIIIYSVQMFIAATPGQHWCRVPELQHLDVELRRNLSIPGAIDGPDWDRCAVFDANWTQVLVTLTPPNSSATKPCQHGWEFLYDDIPYSTVISEREWVCEKAGNGPFAQSIFFLGSLIGCGLFGWMGDKYGRVPALIGANLIGCVGGVATVFTAGVWDFTLSRFLVGMANDSCVMVLYILVLEYVGPGHRTWVSNVSLALYCGGGSLLLVYLALWLLNWRTLVLVTSLPMLLVLVTPWIVPESTRWLASKGKVDKAVKMLRKFERINKKQISEELLEEFKMVASRPSSAGETLKDLVRSSLLRTSLLVLVVVSMVGSLSIDAVLRMSETIGTSFFVTFALSAVAEVPALIIVAVVLDRWGRRNLIVTTMAIAGGLAIFCAFCSKGTIQLVLAVAMRFAVNMAIGALVQLTAEVIPTGVRASGNSVVHLTAYMSAMFSPYIVYSGRYWTPLPLLLVGALCLGAGGLSLMLPETRGRPMPQTIMDAEKLIAEESLWRKQEIKKKEETNQMHAELMLMLERNKGLQL